MLKFGQDKFQRKLTYLLSCFQLESHVLLYMYTDFAHDAKFYE